MTIWAPVPVPDIESLRRDDERAGDVGVLRGLDKRSSERSSRIAPVLAEKNERTRLFETLLWQRPIRSPESSLTLHQSAQNKGDPRTTNVSLHDAIETICYDYLSQTHGGWENNDGAYGIFRFDVQQRRRPHPAALLRVRVDGTHKALALPSGARQRPCRNRLEQTGCQRGTGPRPSVPQIEKRPRPKKSRGR